MSGLSSGVVMVAVGTVRARVVCLRVCMIGMVLGACVCVAFVPYFAFSRGFWMGFDVEECVGCACVAVRCVMGWSYVVL